MVRSPMSQNPTATDWAGPRGEKWLAQLPGVEPTLKPIEEPLIRALRLDAPYRIAEVGCGGGGTALEILRHAPAGSTVHGFDLSPVLIEHARQRIPADESGISFDVANMGAATPPEQPYDRLTSRFGIMFFEDPPAAFANLISWLAPGGRFAFATWGPPPENPWMAIAREVVSEIVEMPEVDPEGPGPFRYAEPASLLAILKQAGFSNLETHAWRGKLPIGGGLPAHEAAPLALASFSSFAELLAEAGDIALNEARKALTARYAEHEQDGIVRIAACVNIFTGEHPR